jgi:4-hydroxy-3-methylbut-2-enyl diphosphate reductase
MPESSQTTPKAPVPWLLLRFDSNYRLVLRRDSEGLLLPECTGTAADPLPSKAHRLVNTTWKNAPLDIYCQVEKELGETETVMSLDSLNAAVEAGRESVSEVFAVALERIEGELFRLPYLELGANEYIYRFRTAKERNREIYIDTSSEDLYQSRLCAAIKAVRRTKEKTSGAPALIDFGPVRYVIPQPFRVLPGGSKRDRTRLRGGCHQSQ